jgi:hypothetical protein
MDKVNSATAGTHGETDSGINNDGQFCEIGTVGGHF